MESIKLNICLPMKSSLVLLHACAIVRIFLVFHFSDKIYQIGVQHLKNFHFSLSIFKNGVKNGVKTLFCMIARYSPG